MGFGNDGVAARHIAQNWCQQDNERRRRKKNSVIVPLFKSENVTFSQIKATTNNFMVKIFVTFDIWVLYMWMYCINMKNDLKLVEFIAHSSTFFRVSKSELTKNVQHRWAISFHYDPSIHYMKNTCFSSYSNVRHLWKYRIVYLNIAVLAIYRYSIRWIALSFFSNHHTLRWKFSFFYSFFELRSQFYAEQFLKLSKWLTKWPIFYNFMQ